MLFWSPLTEGLDNLLFGPLVCNELGLFREGIFRFGILLLGDTGSVLVGTMHMSGGGSWERGIAAIGGGIGVRHGGARLLRCASDEQGLAVPLQVALEGARARIAPWNKRDKISVIIFENVYAKRSNNLNIFPFKGPFRDPQPHPPPPHFSSKNMRFLYQ